MTRPWQAAMAALIMAVLAVSFPAPAAPRGTRIEAVFAKERCAEAQCEAGRDPQISPNAIVRSTIQIHVRSSSELLGLDWVRLEAQVGGDPRWTCVDQWDGAGERDFARRLDWNTVRWHYPPGFGCPDGSTRHYHGEPTTNTGYTLRLKARERVNGEEEVSPVFPIKLANLPARPVWAAKPTTTTDNTGRPTVTLQWMPNPDLRQPDLIEYHFVRSGPAGQAEFVVDAKRPEAQGCRKTGAFSLMCEDTAFPQAGFAGTYRYAVFASRPAPAGRSCSLTAQPCVESQASEIRTVAVRGGATTGSGSASAPPAGSPRQTPAPRPSVPAPVAVEPPEGRDRLAAAAPISKGRPPLVPIAAGLLLAAGVTFAAVHVVRVRRRDS